MEKWRTRTRRMARPRMPSRAGMWTEERGGGVRSAGSSSGAMMRGADAFEDRIDNGRSVVMIVNPSVRADGPGTTGRRRQWNLPLGRGAARENGGGGWADGGREVRFGTGVRFMRFGGGGCAYRTGAA